MLTAYQEMIKVHGWTGTGAMMNMTKSQLEARVYEVKGSGMRVDTALLLQRLSGTTHFAQAVAADAGGVFIDLPEVGDVDGNDLLAKFHELYGTIGDLSKTYAAATSDGEIDARERRQLEAIEQSMHKTMKELMATMFRVYCRAPADKS